MNDGFSPDDDFRDARAEANDPLWGLLARAPRPEPDGWFTARTLARCRLSNTASQPGGMPWKRLSRWLLGSAVALSCAVLALPPFQGAAPVSVSQKNVQEAFAIVASMGDDTDNSTAATPATWPDSSL